MKHSVPIFLSFVHLFVFFTTIVNFPSLFKCFESNLKCSHFTKDIHRERNKVEGTSHATIPSFKLQNKMEYTHSRTCTHTRIQANQ